MFFLLVPLGILTPQPAYAAEIANAYVEQTNVQTHTGDSNWTDISGASLASGNFVEGGKYLLIFNGWVQGSGANNVFGVRAVHGSTAFTGSDYQFEPQAPSAIYKYMWFTVWTAVASEGVKMQFVNIDSTSTTVTADTLTITAIRLDVDLNEGTDWDYNEHASSDAAITIQSGDHADGDRYLVLATQQIPENSATQQHVSNLVRSGEASNTAPIVSWEGEDTTNGIIVMYMANVYALGAADNTFTITETGFGSRSFNNVFAINLEKFKVAAYSYLEDEEALSITDWETLIRTLTFNLSGESGARNSLVMGYFVGDHNAFSNALQSRLQIANADVPTGQTSYTTQHVSWDAVDEQNQGIVTRPNLSAASHTIDLDGDVSAATNTPAAEDRLLVAFTMELATSVVNHPRPISDSLAASETINTQQTLNKPLSDSLAVSETIDPQQGHGEALADSLAASEDVVSEFGAEDHPRSIDDELAASETTDTQQTLNKPLDDELAVSETIDAQQTLNKSLDDELAASEELEVMSDNNRNIADEIAVSETIDTQQTLNKSLDDELAVDESVAATGANERAVSDSLAVSETTDTQQTLNKSLDDEIAVEEDAVASGAGEQLLDDSLAVSETIDTQQTLNKALSDEIAVSEQLDVMTEGIRTLADSLAASETLDKTQSYQKTLADSAAIDESIMIMAEGMRMISDSLAVSEELIAITNDLNPDISDGLSISEILLGQCSGNCGGEIIRNAIVLSVNKLFGSNYLTAVGSDMTIDDTPQVIDIFDGSGISRRTTPDFSAGTITINASEDILIFYQSSWTISSGSNRVHQHLFINGVDYDSCDTHEDVANPNVISSSSFMCLYRATAGDVIDVRVFLDSGSTTWEPHHMTLVVTLA